MSIALFFGNVNYKKYLYDVQVFDRDLGGYLVETITKCEL